MSYLFVWEKMKKAEPAGIGCFLVAMLNSDIRRGLADTPCSVPSSGPCDNFFTKNYFIR